jgi:DNA topoisomerase-6 subunit B
MVAKRNGRTADEMAGEQREISVSEFFVKNRHLLGFDNPLKALLTTVKEGVDNALDACEQGGILPEVFVEIRRVGEPAAVAAAAADAAAEAAAEPSPNGNAAGGASAQPVAVTAVAEARAPDSLFQRRLFDEDVSEDEEAARLAQLRGTKKKAAGRKVTDPPERFVVVIEDNGPGIVAANVGKVFGKLLYGSKFHRLRQQRGQQGIGISAAGMYGQLTTGKPVRITSKTDPRKRAHRMEVLLDLQRNQPEVRGEEEVDWDKVTGTRVEIELEAKYQKGQRSVDTYLRATALANPHVTLVYRDPEGLETRFERSANQLPAEATEVQPHPYGVELGMLIQMLKSTEFTKLGAFLEGEFSRVSARAANEICELSGLNRTTWVSRVAREEAAALHAALGKVKLIDPSTDCISPIGEGLLVDSLAREYPKAFLTAVTRPPKVYRGNPFQVEVALAHGEGIPADQAAQVLRFANRVPLLYQAGACVITKGVNAAPWRNYGIDQPRGGGPVAPMVLVVHVASVWVPFTSESKEAVASYPEILNEVKLAVMQCGRTLGEHLRKHRRVADEMKKREYIARYIPKISEALQKILEFDDAERDATTAKLTDILNRSRNL